MRGAYNLTDLQIDANVLPQPGAYILVNKNNMSVYVGRADSDLNARLKDHLPQNENNICIKRSEAINFYFENSSSAKDAFVLECDWYHRYRPTCNIPHPGKGSINWFCPICGL